MLHDLRILFAKGLENGHLGRFILDVFDRAVFEIVYNGMDTNTGIASSWPAKTMNKVDWHVVQNINLVGVDVVQSRGDIKGRW